MLHCAAGLCWGVGSQTSLCQTSLKLCACAQVVQQACPGLSQGECRCRVSSVCHAIMAPCVWRVTVRVIVAQN